MTKVLCLIAAFLPFATVAAAQGPPGGPPPPPEVAVITVQPEAIPVSFEFVGATEASRVVEIRARIQGFLDTREFEEGALIEEGTTLFKIDPRSFEADRDVAQALVEQAESRLQLAKQEVDRLQSVSVPGAIAQSDLDRRVAEQTNAAAALRLAEAELAKANLQLSYSTIEAPLTGYIGKALREIGSLVDAGQNSLLAVMHQVDPIYVSFSVSEREYLQWQQEVTDGKLVLTEVEEPYLEIRLLDGTLYPERGELDFLDVAVDLSTGTVEMRATFPNPQRLLKPGQFVKAFVQGYSRPDTIAVPQRAVGQSPQGAYLYVVTSENTVEFRPITPGAWSNGSWIIQEGLSAGETIIVEGLVKVQPGVTVVPTPYEPGDASPATAATASAPTTE